MTPRQEAIKRTFDLTVSLAGLAVLWPVIFVCAIVAARETGMSGIYTQRRVGRGGREFLIRKIRSMRAVPGMEANTVTVSADPRVTRAGTFMRRWKLDELPQLWNVLVGEMSLVGPRPDVRGYADRLDGEARDILALRPGITGPATIKYRDEEMLLAAQPDPIFYNDRMLYPDKVRLNLEYLHHWTLSKDLRYILMTVGLIAPPKWLDSPTTVDGGGR